MTEWAAWIGREQVQRDTLTPALLARFRATFDSPAMDPIAPHGIHWCLCTPETPTTALDSDGHPRRGDFLPPVPLPRRMWAASKLVFGAMIHTGARIERRSTIVGVDTKTGGTGELVFVDIDHETTSNGVMAIKERQTIVYREAPSNNAVATTTRMAAVSDYEWHREVLPDAPLLFRYSALTFNSHRIHYDADYAISSEGYRGVVVHGPLTATLLLDLMARETGGRELREFAFRGVSPAIVGERLHLVGRNGASNPELAAMTDDGRVVMTATAALAV